MFYKCSNITEIDLSNFNTSYINNMESMFSDCTLLSSLNLSNFDTSKVKWMNFMFSDCTLLTSLNLSNFDTSKVEQMNGMFSFCSSLTSLNLSNFDTSKVKQINNMFDGCTNLEYINMLNFNESCLSRSSDYSDIFNNVPKNIVLCINKDNILNIIYNKIIDIMCRREDCSDDWKLNQNKIIEGNDECFNNCSDLYPYEYNGQCISHCPNGDFNDENNITKCKCELVKCLTCPKVAYNIGLCTKCNDNYYPMENDPSNLGEYFNCYNETPNGYYFDKNELLYKKCYYACETCEIKGNDEFHYCLKCNIEFNFEINTSNYINCYENCNYYYYFDNNNNYHCTESSSCPPEYPHLIHNKNECVIEDEKSIENFIDDIFNNTISEDLEREDEINKYNKILEKIESLFTSDNYDLTDIDRGEDQIINAHKIQITFTNTENQKNNIKSNMSTIDLGECETLLRNYYNLTNKQTIYIKKLDITQDGMKAKKVEYNVYSKLSSKKLEKLNLTICENTKISINIPIEIEGNIDKFNTSSGYYNDICYATTSDDGTDISLKDRKQEYIDGDNIICQDDCEFSSYNSEIKKAKCECFAKESNLSFTDMIINKMKLLDNIKDIRNLMNLKILICYKKLLLSLSSINHNIGCLIIICIIAIHIISIFVFYINQLKKIQKMIENIIFGISNINFIKQLDKTKNKIKFSKRKRMLKRNNKINKNTFFENMKSHKGIKNKKEKLYNHNFFNNNLKKTSNIITSNNKNKKINFSELNNNKDKNIKKLKKIIKYNTEEMNDLPYNLALNYDKRKYCQFYIALLSVKHNLIYSFYNYDDYNSRIIKIDLFFVGLTMDYAVNALFFNDETMHKIYIDKGLFNWDTQIPITIYSFLISNILNYPLSILGLSNDSIIAFKQNLKNIGIKKRSKKLFFCLKLKFIFYFIISFIFLLFFWYYISVFGVVYKNTQYHLLKDTLISFGLSLIYPFITCLLPGLFRIPSLSNPKKKRECLYNFSKIFQLI